MRQVGQYLVAADIQGAEDYRPVFGLIENAPIELGLFDNSGEAVPHHERDLGAKEPDPFGAGRPGLGQVDQQPGIELQRDGDAFVTQSACGAIDRHSRPAVRPPAPERQVQSESQLARPGAGESQGVQECARQKRQVASARCGIVERQRIHRLDFEPTDARLPHRAHFALELGGGHRGSKPPPPPHQDSALGRRVREQPAEIVQTPARGLCGRGERRNQPGADDRRGPARHGVLVEHEPGAAAAQPPSGRPWVFRYVNRARADRSRTARRETGVSRYVPRPTRAPLRPRRSAGPIATGGRCSAQRNGSPRLPRPRGSADEARVHLARKRAILPCAA